MGLKVSGQFESQMFSWWTIHGGLNSRGVAPNLINLLSIISCTHISFQCDF